MRSVAEAQVRATSSVDVISRPCITLLAGYMDGANGGIASYMRRLVEILEPHCARHNGMFNCVRLRMPRSGSEWTGVPESMLRPAAADKVRYVLDVLKTVVRQRPALIIAGHLAFAPLAWMLYKAGLARSYAVVLHGTEAWTRGSILSRVAAADAQFVIATTRFTAVEFARCNECDYRAISILPLGLKDASMPDEVLTPSAGTGLKVLTVGRFAATERYKGVDTLIEVLGIARRMSVPMSLTVVGGGDDLPRLQQLSKVLGVSEQVAFLGSVSDQQLQEKYRDCDVFAMPSKGEGFGLVFLEAMRWGKPCIGGNHGGIPEVITDGHDGFLVDFGDVSTTFERLRQLAVEPLLRRRMGANARQTVASRFLFPHLQQRWCAFADSALGVRRLPSRYEGVV